MLSRFDALAAERGNHRAVLVSGLTFATVMLAMTWAVTAFHDAYGVGILNLSGARNAAAPQTGGYTPDQAYQWLAAYGPQGRIQHLAILALDLPLILSATAFTGLGLHLAARRLGPGRSQKVRRAALFIALAGPVLNLVEDAGLTVLLLAHPTRLDPLAAALSTVNAAKSVAYTIALAATLIALTAAAIATAIGRMHRTGPTEDTSVAGRRRSEWLER